MPAFYDPQMCVKFEETWFKLTLIMIQNGSSNTWILIYRNQTCGKQYWLYLYLLKLRNIIKTPTTQNFSETCMLFAQNYLDIFKKLIYNCSIWATKCIDSMFIDDIWPLTVYKTLAPPTFHLCMNYVYHCTYRGYLNNNEECSIKTLTVYGLERKLYIRPWH